MAIDPAVAHPVCLADGTPAQIGKPIVWQPETLTRHWLAGVLIAIAPDSVRGQRLAIALLRSGCCPGWHLCWAEIEDVDPAHCFSSVPRGLESIPSGQEIAGQAA